MNQNVKNKTTFLHPLPQKFSLNFFYKEVAKSSDTKGNKSKRKHTPRTFLIKNLQYNVCKLA